jgi:ABC-2 type transport system permease protein
MNKIVTLFKREYKAAVRTKSFIISLVMVPIFMGGGFLAVIIMENKVDTEDKHFVIIDHSGIMEEPFREAMQVRNTQDIINPENGEQTGSKYFLGFEKPDTIDPVGQQAILSDRVKRTELYAYVEIGKDILHPSQGTETFLKYYSEHAFADDTRYWFRGILNDYLREQRAAELNLEAQQTSDLLYYIQVEGMGLVTTDEKTGEQQEAERANEAQSFFIPYILLMLMFMMVMMTTTPLLSYVMEEKNEKIAEVLLGSITPFQFMMGKVLGGVGVALTTLAIYVSAGVFTAQKLGAGSMIPYDVLPWFFVFSILFILMVGSGMAALGATCNDSKDAQSITFPAIIPVILPMFIIVPVIADPNGPLATALSLIPPFTPTLMVVRMATPVTIPLWQPLVGLIGVILFTLFSVWIGARVFRTAILIQGQKPTVANLFKYAFKS